MLSKREAVPAVGSLSDIRNLSGVKTGQGSESFMSLMLSKHGLQCRNILLLLSVWKTKRRQTTPVSCMSLRGRTESKIAVIYCHHSQTFAFAVLQSNTIPEMKIMEFTTMFEICITVKSLWEAIRLTHIHVLSPLGFTDIPFTIVASIPTPICSNLSSNVHIFAKCKGENHVCYTAHREYHFEIGIAFRVPVSQSRYFV